MKVRAGYDITLACNQPTPTVFMLQVHPDRQSDILGHDAIQLDPPVPVTTYRDLFGNIAARVQAPAGPLRVQTRFDILDSGLPDDFAPDAAEVPIHQLPPEAMPFLVASRYCETDLLSNTAWNLFGHTPPGWARVQAIVDYVHNHIRFDYQLARSTRTASDGHHEQVGVCRDFAHLAVTFCRCMNIPARYCTGYLGDIGVPLVPDPMDFSAWFEVYLGGRWYTFDARHNRPRVARIVIARGRDAADVAIYTTFGPSSLLNFTVYTDEVHEGA